MTTARIHGVTVLAGVAFVLAWSVPVRASAEAVVVVSRGGDPRIAPAERTRAVDAVVEALRASGADVREVAAAPELARCADPGCVGGVARARSLDFVVSVSLFAAAREAANVESVSVTMTNGRGAQFSGSAQVEGGDVHAAALRAAIDAKARAARGEGPFLIVEGEPAGAIVAVDGTDLGNVPFSVAVSPGTHRVAVRLDGFEPHTSEVIVPEDPGREARVDVRLQRRGIAPPLRHGGTGGVGRGRGAEATGSTDGSLVRELGVSALGVAGVALVTTALVGIAMGVQCDRLGAVTGECTAGSRPAVVPVAIYGVLGIGALVGAFVWLIAGNAEDAERDRASPVRVRADGVSIDASL